jgi:hypothetical protein
LPCSVNYYKYKNNYEKYVDSENKDNANGSEKEVIKTIASPRLMKKLNPIAKLGNSIGINVNPVS